MGAIGEIFRLTMSYSATYASVAQNVFYYQLSGSATDDDDILDLLEAWTTNAWGGIWDDIAGDDATLESIQVDVINVDGTVARNLGNRTIAVGGAAGFNVMPAGVSGYLMLNTAVPKARGSKYVPFVAENLIDDGDFSAAGLALLVQLFAEYLANKAVPGGGTLVSGVLSRALLSFVGFSGEGLFESTPAYQRRRKPNIGS